eukprot:TRINITY_DN13972_c0_g1_i1.p1 TRINITY_DN13972_c0_g1~~TRINITY_DN13972_c0_g1_i1.p1  ORF type:complete len:322 (-),score=82.33 TRINITY_DN13972_c0_g1_i1:245-1210(-)
MSTRREKKQLYERKLFNLLTEYNKALLVHCDNVGSRQFMEIRRGLRPDSIVLMGKNTLMKRCIRLYCETNNDETWLPIVDYLVGNVGLIFTKSDLSGLKDEIGKYVVPAPAKVGIVAQDDVTVPAGNTGMGPENTSFFQTLGISTKINKGSIEILNDIQLIKKGDKVGASESTLLSKLNIKPFKYGLVVQQVYDSGVVFAPQVLDISDDDLMAQVKNAIANCSNLAVGLGYPSIMTVPSSVLNAYKNVLAIAVATQYSFPLADKIKEMLENPELFMAQMAAAAPTAAAGEAAPAAKEEAKAPEPEEEDEESDDDMGFSLFD